MLWKCFFCLSLFLSSPTRSFVPFYQLVHFFFYLDLAADRQIRSQYIFMLASLQNHFLSISIDWVLKNNRFRLLHVSLSPRYRWNQYPNKSPSESKSKNKNKNSNKQVKFICFDKIYKLHVMILNSFQDNLQPDNTRITLPALLILCCDNKNTHKRSVSIVKSRIHYKVVGVSWLNFCAENENHLFSCVICA